MKLSDIAQWVDEIAQYANERDFGTAHILEDDLYRDLLVYLASSDENITVYQRQSLCNAALATRQIKFARYCA